MSGTFFEISIPALIYVAALIVGIFWLLRLKATFAAPELFVSTQKDLLINSPSWRVQGTSFIRYLEYASLGFFLLAFIDPHLQVLKQIPINPVNPTQGIAIYLLADRSGSMNEYTSSESPKAPKGSMTKIELLKKVAIDFVNGNPAEGLNGRPQDLIGLIGFARVAHVLVPLTLDHDQVVAELSSLQTVKNKDDDGTAMGYAIFKTVNMMATFRHYAEQTPTNETPAYDIQSNAIVLITDGFQEVNPKDAGNSLRDMGLEDAAQYAKDNKVRLFVINVEPAFGSEEFLPHRHLMERITKLTDGQFFMVHDTTHLNQVYAALNQLEKSLLPATQPELLELPKDQQPHRYQRVSIYPYLIELGLALLLLSVILKTVVLRQVP